MSIEKLYSLLNGRIWTFYQFKDSFKTDLLPHDKSAVAGGSEPSSTSHKGGDSSHHAICNPMLAERDVQTKQFEKGSV